MNIEEMWKTEAKLISFAELDNDEFGEACLALCKFKRHSSYISEGLDELVEYEITRVLEYYEDNYEIKDIKKQKIININSKELVKK